MHPLNPAHPQYAELVEAGRAPAHPASLWPEVERDPLACSYEYEDRRGGPVTCEQPATYVVGRADGRGVELRLCDRDLPNYVTVTPGDFVVKRITCSVCDDLAEDRYQLDESGRCDECRP